MGCRYKLQLQREFLHEIKQLYNPIVILFWTQGSEVGGKVRFGIDYVSQRGDAGFCEAWGVCYAVRVDYTHNHINSTEHMECEMDLATAQQFQEIQ